jgi:hypothetical protein
MVYLYVKLLVIFYIDSLKYIGAVVPDNSIPLFLPERGLCV